MPFIPLRQFGSVGVVHDTVAEALPIGAWSDVRNMRFAGTEMEKMLEPTLEAAFDEETNGRLIWAQTFDSVFATELVVASYKGDTFPAEEQGSYLWFLLAEAPPPAVPTWTLAGGPYSLNGTWQSFGWGTTCIFNNGVEKPQIFDTASGLFEDLPNWGIISNVDDLTFGNPPSEDVNARCKIILPYKNFLVALGITEAGSFGPNTVWWSDATALAGLEVTSIDNSGPPSWDYISPATLSGQSEVGLGSGPLQWAAELNEGLICYTTGSATSMQFTGGTYIMQFRRLFNKGATGLHTAVEVNNQHLVVTRDQIYVHDGSTVSLIAKDRVENEFFRRIGKGGRFGTGSADFSTLQVVKNPDRKEIYVLFNDAIYDPYDPETPVVEIECTEVPIFLVHPADVEVGEVGQIVTFTVVLQTDEDFPATIQWYKDGGILTGQTATTLQYTVEEGDAYAQFNAVATNECGAVTSRPALLVEATGTTPPDPIPEGCEPYACDALETELLLYADSFWRINADLGTFPDLKGERPLTAVGGARNTTTTGVFGDSSCEGEGALVIDGSTGTVNNHFESDNFGTEPDAIFSSGDEFGNSIGLGAVTNVATQRNGVGRIFAAYCGTRYTSDNSTTRRIWTLDVEDTGNAGVQMTLSISAPGGQPNSVTVDGAYNDTHLFYIECFYGDGVMTQDVYFDGIRVMQNYLVYTLEVGEEFDLGREDEIQVVGDWGLFNIDHAFFFQNPRQDDRDIVFAGYNRNFSDYRLPSFCFDCEVDEGTQANLRIIGETVNLGSAYDSALSNESAMVVYNDFVAIYQDANWKILHFTTDFGDSGIDWSANQVSTPYSQDLMDNYGPGTGGSNDYDGDNWPMHGLAREPNGSKLYTRNYDSAPRLSHYYRIDLAEVVAGRLDITNNADWTAANIPYLPFQYSGPEDGFVGRGQCGEYTSNIHFLLGEQFSISGSEVGNANGGRVSIGEDSMYGGPVGDLDPDVNIDPVGNWTRGDYWFWESNTGFYDIGRAFKNAYSIGNTIYGAITASDRSSYLAICYPTNQDVVDSSRRAQNYSWNGTGWSYVQQGSWGVNPYYPSYCNSQAMDLYGRGYGGIGGEPQGPGNNEPSMQEKYWSSDYVEYITIPAGGYDDEDDEQFGIWYIPFEDNWTAYTCDLSSLITREDPTDGDLTWLRLKYIPDWGPVATAKGGKWALAYCFQDTTGGDYTSHFYMRIMSRGDIPYQPLSWSNAVKFNLPDEPGNPGNQLQIDPNREGIDIQFNRLRKEVVFVMSCSPPMTYVMAIADPYECPPEENN